MVRNAVVSVRVAVLTCVLALPSAVWAQSPSGIAGVVRDTSGGVLPGVTVEAASPALIEKVRTVVTDGEGRYNIVDLRSGTYTVSFTLIGFSTFRREGIELGAGFTATVNANMQLGSLEETITVTGAAPLVDTQNVRQQKVISRELLTALPTGQTNITTLVALTPGMSGNSDVGGGRGLYVGQQGNASFHGKQGMKTQFDGMRIQNFCSGTAAAYTYNIQTVEEVSVETGGVSAEGSSTGIAMNLIPKEGSNLFKFGVTGLYTNDHLQASNLTEELRGRGLLATPKVLYIHDWGGIVGGPIRKDKVWFFGAFRKWGLSNQLVNIFWNQTQGTPFYTPDLSRPGDRPEWNRSHAGRVTWQISEKNKLSGYTDLQHNRVQYSTYTGGTAAVEATPGWNLWPTGIFQTTWSSPRTSRLLLEAGFASTNMHFPEYDQVGVQPDDVSILEQSTGFRYNAPISLRRPTNVTDRYSERFSAAYVTGSHAFKVGFQNEQGIADAEYHYHRPDGVSYEFLRGAPVSVVQNISPYHTKAIGKADIGVFAQDQWSLKRLTLSYGLRYEYVNGYVPAQHLDAGPFVPARDFPAVHKVPEWQDFQPRLGAAYDLFGTGRTALKVSLGRYGDITGGSFVTNNDPVFTSVNRVTRPWIDANGNYVANCNFANFSANGECGPISNQNFGKLNPSATRYADDVLHGFGARLHTWDLGTEVQQQLGGGISMTAGYYHNQTGGYRVTDNLVVTPADFSPYCITAPSDPRLPSGGGYQVCGLYDVNPDKFGQSSNLVTRASHFGKQTRVSDFFNISLNTRFASGIQLGGGVDTGRIVDDSCFVVDSPAALLNCHVVAPLRGNTQMKASGSYPLPGAFIVSATFQNLPGAAYEALYSASNAEIAPSLRRNLAGNVRSATVPLLTPQAQFEDRRTQIDLRLSKVFMVWGKARVQANVDFYNLLNSSAITSVVSTYGPRWRVPLEILGARMIQIGGRFDF